MSRFSSQLISEDLLKDADIKEASERFETLKELEHVYSRASIILGILVASKDFPQTFLYNSPDDLHVFCHDSKRIIVVDLLTRCAIDQLANFDTYKFVATPSFEKKISTYTHTTDKPNLQLSKNRTWDVALCVVLKVEALDSNMASIPSYRLLFREHSILKHVWESYVREHIELDEMAGIPMVFDYMEVPNSVYNDDEADQIYIVDVYGGWMPWKSETGTPTSMSYMSMEKMGPNIRYLQELMVHTKRRTRTFDLETSFKIFDQLVCRLMQLHRFSVVHNAVEPKNIYFGRSSTFSVLYLGNYTRAMIVDAKERKMADVFLGGDPRYTSHYRARGTYPNPLHDIESVFYTLLSMIVSNLPWDVYLVKDDATPRQSEIKNTSNQVEILEGTDSHPKIREMKTTFWKSLAGINRVLADMRYLSVGSPVEHVNLATEIVRELYNRIREEFQAINTISRTSFLKNLSSAQSNEYNFYLELRRIALLFFRFESISVSLCTPTYQKKIEAVARDTAQPRAAWDMSNWCFNVVQMNAPGNVRLSVNPVSFVARTNI